MRSADDAVKTLSRSGRDLFDGPDAVTCWKAACDASGYAGELSDFIATAKRRGLMCNQIRGARNDEPPLFRVFVPATGLGGWSGRS